MNNLDAQAWYRSPVQIAQITSAISAVIAIFPKLGQLLGMTTPGEISNTVTVIFGAISIIAPVYGSIKRAASKIQPLTLTQEGADVHPNTLANINVPFTLATKNASAVTPFLTAKSPFQTPPEPK
jgi:hypothetical protein